MDTAELTQIGTAIDNQGNLDWESLCELGRLAAQDIDNGKWKIGEYASLIQPDNANYGNNTIEEYAKEINRSKRSVYQYQETHLYYEKVNRGAFLETHPLITWTHMRDAMRLKDVNKSYEFLEEANDKGWTVDQARLMLANEGYDGNEWYTPATYIEAVRRVMDTIDLDPASCEYAQKTVRADQYYTKKEDGLIMPWHGNVWLNPPYSYPEVENFTGTLINRYKSGSVQQAIVLINNCTDAKWFQNLLSQYTVCFTNGRIPFERPDRTIFATRQGQAFFYLGADDHKFVDVFQEFGTILRPI